MKRGFSRIPVVGETWVFGYWLSGKDVEDADAGTRLMLPRKPPLSPRWTFEIFLFLV